MGRRVVIVSCVGEDLVVPRRMLRWVLWTERWQGGRRKVASGESVDKVVAVRFALAGLPTVVVGKVVKRRDERLAEGLGTRIGGGVGEGRKVTLLLLTRVSAGGGCCC